MSISALLFLLVAAFESLAADVDASFSYKVYTDYRDIPGVTSEDIAAVERLKAAYDSFEFGAGGSNETFVRDEDGSIGGFSRYFCDWLTDLFDTPFNLSIHRLADLGDELARGDVDFTCEFAPTRDVQERMIMTDAVINRAVTRFRLENSMPLTSISMKRPLRYGFVQWHQTVTLVDEAVDQNFDAFYYSRREDAVASLRNGDIDAFVMDARGEAAFNQFDDIKQEVFFPLVYASGSFATLKPDLAPIVNVIQKFLETKDAGPFLSGIYRRGEAEFKRNNFSSMLSRNEKEFIWLHTGKGDAIRFAAEYDNYPASFYNHREGELQGIAIDILKEVSSLTGLTFAPATHGKGDWANVREIFDRGEAPLITELIYSRERRDKYLWTDFPYATSEFALISRNTTPTVPYDKIADMCVGTVGASAFEDTFRDFFPNHKKFMLFDGLEEAFYALGTGKIDLFMASSNIMLYATNYLERTDFKINIAFNRKCESAFGFFHDQHLLRSIVSKAQMLIDADGIARSWKQRAFDYRRRMLEEQIPYHIAFASSLLIVVTIALYLFYINENIRKGLAATVMARTKELQLQTVAAQNASHAKGEFLARMSHEMRTPLNAIAGMANIARNTDDKDKSDESAEKIERASRELRAIIDNIIKISEIESETQDMPRADFEVKKMLDSVMGLAETLAREKFQTIVLNVSDDVPEVVEGNGVHIGQTLRNLLSNAVKFSPQGESILLNVSIDPEWNRGDSIGLRFDVIDHGIGISSEESLHLFQAFEQLEDYKDRRHGGVGIGLVISKRLVEMMGGKTYLESKVGEGSNFYFVVPVTKR